MPSLTSIGLIYVTAGLVAVLLIGLLLIWPRLSGRGPRYWLLRLLALSLLQVAGLGLMFLVVNYQFGFYASWADLFGKSNGGGTLVGLSNGPANRSAPLVIRSSTPVRLRPADPASAAGTLDVIRIQGTLSGMAQNGFAYLPPGYPDKHRRYPVIVAISGSGDRAYDPGQLAADAASAIRSGKLSPVILVMLRPPRYDAGCLNLPGRDQASTYFAQDVPDAVSMAFTTSQAPGGWALLGDSAGGYCALQLTLTSAFSYSAAALPPGDYTAPPDGNPIGSLTAFKNADNLNYVFEHYPMQPVSLLFTGASPGVNPFQRAARPPARTASMEPPAGASALTPVLEWLGSRLSAGTGA